ncbi:hypothetical protein CPC08DRAFT_244325 [Agrocybe pediades]|nr:hypothetical protein CPC08DRAFT_244325 [Agrocybe pediades]
MFDSQQSCTDWPLPLPYDLVRLIIFSYLQYEYDCPQSICRLSLACTALADLCRPLKFRDVTIHLGEDPHSKAQMKALFRLLDSDQARGLDISYCVRHLRITDDYRHPEGRYLKKPQEVDYEKLSYFLAREFRNMERLTLSLQAETWSRLPPDLSYRLRHLLARRTLHTVIITENSHIPEDYLRAVMKDIPLLQLDGDVGFQPSGSACHRRVDMSSRQCTPHQLMLKDSSRTGTNISSLLPQGPHSPFNLSRLTKLEVSTRGPHIAILNDVLDACSSTMEELALYVATWGGLPAPLHLKNLKALKALTLAVDAEMMPYGDRIGSEAPLRFNWFVSALETCQAVAGQLEFIGLVLRIKSYLVAEKLDWKRLDGTLTSCASISNCALRPWSILRIFEILVVMEGNKVEEALLAEVFAPLVPGLCRRKILKVGVSSERMSFWRM